MQGAVASRVARAKDRSSSIAESNVSIELHSIIFSISLNRSRFIVHLPFFSHNPCNLLHIQDDPVLPNSDKTKTSARYTVLSIVYQVYKAYRCLAALWGAVLGLPFVYSPPGGHSPISSMLSAQQQTLPHKPYSAQSGNPQIAGVSIVSSSSMILMSRIYSIIVLLP